MAQASKAKARAAWAWRLTMLCGMLAAAAQIFDQQRQIDELRRRLDQSRPAPAPAPEEVWTAAPKASEQQPVDLNSAADAKHRAEQHYLSGVIYYQKGDYDKARSEWLLARQSDPSNEDALAGLQRLDAAPSGR